jgi:ribosomal protein L11 methyltransferase
VTYEDLGFTMAVSASNISHPGWLEISIRVHAMAAEPLSAFLFDLGCLGLTSEDTPSTTLIKTYLPFREDFDNLQQRIDSFLSNLKGFFPECDSYQCTIRRIEDEDWNRNWRRFFYPDRVTPRLMVVPAWEPLPRNMDGEVIRMDPGPAFGTGQHATTRLCLAALEMVDLPPSWSLLDVGTGAGILALYGAKLGASRVVAIDLDPEALRWAKKNFELNDLEASIELSSAPIEKMDGRFSLLTANLILHTIMELLPHFKRLLDPGGWLILSGILAGQTSEIERGLMKFDFQESRFFYQEEWACSISRKQYSRG